MRPTEIVIAAGGAVTLACYAVFILAPAWGCYGRLWERLAATILTLFILATLLGVGAVLGVAIVWSYDRFA